MLQLVDLPVLTYTNVYGHRLVAVLPCPGRRQHPAAIPSRRLRQDQPVSQHQTLAVDDYTVE
jgi:hypothetical protein